jgi:hypothetical protein
MSETSAIEATGEPALDDALARLQEAVADLAAAELAALVRMDRPSLGLHAAARAVEVARRRLTDFDSHYIAALEVGGEPARFAYGSTAAFLREQLRLSLHEARRRVEVAHGCQPRPGLSGLPLPCEAPDVADAVSRGAISSEHADVVLRVLNRLPAPVRAEHGAAVEAELVQIAEVTDPGRLSAFGEQVVERADPDGVLRDMAYRHAHRGGFLRRRRGGGGRMELDLDDVGLEKMQSALDPLLKPLPEGPDGKDPRSSAARFHDAVVALAERALAAGDLPASGGSPTTLVVHVTADQLRSRRGFATTDHGNRLPMREALQLADNAVVYTLLTDGKGVPLELHRTARIASPGQTLALAARDRGCTFPGCDRPPSWCQRHHVEDWLEDGPTNVGNLTLLCGHHHREFARRGWMVTMLDGLPWWTPPAWIDPARTPVRNQVHRAIS